MAVVFLTVPLETVTALKVEALDAGLKVARAATTGVATREAVQETILNAGAGQAQQENIEIRGKSQAFPAALIHGLVGASVDDFPGSIRYQIWGSLNGVRLCFVSEGRGISVSLCGNSVRADSFTGSNKNITKKGQSTLTICHHVHAARLACVRAGVFDGVLPTVGVAEAGRPAPLMTLASCRGVDSG